MQLCSIGHLANILVLMFRKPKYHIIFKRLLYWPNCLFVQDFFLQEEWLTWLDCGHLDFLKNQILSQCVLQIIQLSIRWLDGNWAQLTGATRIRVSNHEIASFSPKKRRELSDIMTVCMLTDDITCWKSIPFLSCHMLWRPYNPSF